MNAIKLTVAFVALFTASTFLLMGSGLYPDFDFALSLLLSVFILLFTASNKAFKFILIPLIIAHIFYIPTGLSFGAPNYQYVASLFATDFLETKEFFAQIPLKNYCIALSVLPLILIFRKITLQLNIQLYKNRTFLIFALLLFAYHLPVSQLLRETYRSTMQVKAEMDKLKALALPSKWGKSDLNAKYDDYVLIIGESARRDYLHAYGYPVENTPFMSSANGTLINGLNSAGTNTVASLRLMLTKPNTTEWQPNYELSLVDLIKSAGLKTYWLSNQGSLGEYDTPIAALASKSDDAHFLKTGTYNSSNNSDFELLPIFREKLAQPSAQKRFFVLHLYGSHPLACDRLEDYPKIFKENEIDEKYHYLNCYISSIKKTDEVLKQVYEILDKNQQTQHRSFSMVYFSDHGLCHEDLKSKDILFNQNCFSQFHNQVPLFKISSDDTARHEYNVFKSGLNFTDGIANWIGIQNPQLNQTVNLFENIADSEDYGLAKKVRERKTPAEPAIDIRPKK